MTKNKTIIYIGAVVLIAALVFLPRLNKRPAKETIQIVKPVTGSIQTVITATATVQPQNRLEIKPPINGRIEEILVKEGEHVKAGQTLAWMSSTERAALLDAARARGPEALKYWEDVYKPTPLIAPIEGDVIVSTDQPGQTITASDVVVVLSDHLIVQAQVDETDIGRVQLGQEAWLSLDAYPQIKVKGKVDHIYYESKVVNNVTIYQVDIVPDSVPDVFRSGMSASVNIIENAKEDVLTIPVDAVERGKEGPYVMLDQGPGKKPLQRMVDLGISDDKNIEVISGITQDDKIVTVKQKYVPSSQNKPGSNPFMPQRKKS